MLNLRPQLRPWRRSNTALDSHPRTPTPETSRRPSSNSRAKVELRRFETVGGSASKSAQWPPHRTSMVRAPSIQRCPLETTAPTHVHSVWPRAQTQTASRPARGDRDQHQAGHEGGTARDVPRDRPGTRGVRGARIRAAILVRSAETLVVVLTHVVFANCVCGDATRDEDPTSDQCDHSSGAQPRAAAGGRLVARPCGVRRPPSNRLAARRRGRSRWRRICLLRVCARGNRTFERRDHRRESRRRWCRARNASLRHIRCPCARQRSRGSIYSQVRGLCRLRAER